MLPARAVFEPALTEARRDTRSTPTRKADIYKMPDPRPFISTKSYVVHGHEHERRRGDRQLSERWHDARFAPS